MQTKQEIMDRGYQAEQALPYLTSVTAIAREMLLDRMMNLKPDQTMMFSIFSSQMQCLDDILMLVQGDINDGQAVINQLQENTPETGSGIL